MGSRYGKRHDPASTLDSGSSHLRIESHISPPLFPPPPQRRFPHPPSWYHDCRRGTFRSGQDDADPDFVSVLRPLKRRYSAGWTAVAGKSGGRKGGREGRRLLCMYIIFKPFSSTLYVSSFSPPHFSFPQSLPSSLLNKEIALVGQSPNLFSGSIAYNIAYGEQSKRTEAEIENDKGLMVLPSSFRPFPPSLLSSNHLLPLFILLLRRLGCICVYLL